ncbi:hypothetical protein LMG27174_07156 [Paraburkholderia rhynchosiae]|uniref:Uncharacterized protein n=1 Tax=Paraburkholderia rhynchosiae TaxID=487049 RepID=A0A6J5CU87_9BURK|nr:hypothetical protein LMG27174_07156 [Paraburkholderia rhynchosiae]
MPAQRLAVVIPFPSINRPYVLRFRAQDGTRAVVPFADCDERDERGAQLLPFGSTVTLATVQGAA